MTDPAGKLAQALRIAEAALADIGDADREPGDDLAWCERRAAKALPQVRAALAAHDSAQPLTASMITPAQLAALAREKAEPVCAVCDGPNTYDRASGVCRECQDVAEHDTHPTAPAEADERPLR